MAILRQDGGRVCKRVVNNSTISGNNTPTLISQ